MQSSKTVQALAAEIGIDLVAVGPAEPLHEAFRRMDEAATPGAPAETSNYASEAADFPEEDWHPRGLEDFCDPRSALPCARSVICAAQCYLEDEPDDLSRPGEPHGLVSRYTRRNYYRDLKGRLEKLGKALCREAGKKAAWRAFSNGPLAEKSLAERAGLGSYGKNGIILTRGFGSWVVLGELVTELELEPAEPQKVGCGDCRACLEACPTKAIVAPMRLDRSRCLQHLTNAKGPLERGLRTPWGRRLYGCTTCQDVCPKNRGVKASGRKVARGSVGPSLPLIPLLGMSEREYRTRCAGNQMAASWVRFESIRRNACVALGNSGDPAAVPALAGALARDPSPLVRGHAAWALGRFAGAGDTAARRALEAARPGEDDPSAAGEIAAALEGADS